MVKTTCDRHHVEVLQKSEWNNTEWWERLYSSICKGAQEGPAVP